MAMQHGTYKGYMDKNINFVYAVTADGIIVSGGQIEENSSTAQCSKAVVTAVCTLEHIAWQDQRFVDVQTHLGYPGQREGWCAINVWTVYGHHGLITRVSQRPLVPPTTNACNNMLVIDTIPREILEELLTRIGNSTAQS